MKLTSDQIEALRRLGGWAEELAYKVYIGEKVTVEREVKRWEPKGGNYFLSVMGVVGNASTLGDEFRIHGVERETREAANRLAHDQRIFNRLHAYREEFAPGYKVPEIGKPARFPYMAKSGLWESGVDADMRVPACVYMPADVVSALCRKLNSGEVVL